MKDDNFEFTGPGIIEVDLQKNIFPGGKLQNDIANVATDFLGDTIEAADEQMQNALKAVDDGLDKCADNPGALVTQEFTPVA